MQDRYHATAVDTEGYLARCMVYIDLYMVQAGVVSHPRDWHACGYRELQNPLSCYRMIDRDALMALLGIGSSAELARVHAGWIEQALREHHLFRDKRWLESLAVGRRDFVTGVRSKLGVSAMHREIFHSGDLYSVREAAALYTADFGPKKPVLSFP